MRVILNSVNGESQHLRRDILSDLHGMASTIETATPQNAPVEAYVYICQAKVEERNAPEPVGTEAH